MVSVIFDVHRWIGNELSGQLLEGQRVEMAGRHLHYLETLPEVLLRYPSRFRCRHIGVRCKMHDG